MRSFEELSRGGQSRRMRVLANGAVAQFPVRVARMERLAAGFNTTFRVEAADGERFLLRVHRADGPTEGMIRAELAWLAALNAQTELVVPRPVPAVNGDALVTAGHPGVPGARVCTLLRWTPGRFVHDRLTPGHLWRVGVLMARLQEHGASFAARGRLDRGRVDGIAGGQSEETAERAAALVAELDTAAAGRAVVQVVDEMCRIREMLGHGADAYGLIHADLHQENYLFDRGQVAAIDFDDCGFGHYAYDLAVTISELPERADVRRLRAALLDGYRSVRPLSVGQEDAIEYFIAFRHLQLMMCVLQHRHHPDFRDRWPAYLAHGLRAIRGLLDGRG